MINHDFNNIEVSDGTTMDVYVSFPENKNCPCIILFQEAFGVNHHIRNVAERLSIEGYAVVAPDLYHRTAHRLEAAYTDFPSLAPHFQAINNQNLKADIQATFDWLSKQDQINKEKVGSLGFCMGGRVSILANTFLPLLAGISFYGGGSETLADLTAEIKGSLLLFWGGMDKHITEEKRNTLTNALKNSGVEFTNVVINNADHGFFCDERSSYHPLAAKEAWAHTLQFLANRLK